MAASSSAREPSPAVCNATKVASAVNAPTVSTSPCENLMTSSTPKNSVKPTATSAYIMPSISPFMAYCASSPAFIVDPRAGRRAARQHRPDRRLLLPRQLALARRVFAVVPFDELAVLDHVSGDHRHSVLAVVVE